MPKFPKLGENCAHLALAGFRCDTGLGDLLFEVILLSLSNIGAGNSSTK